MGPCSVLRAQRTAMHARECMHRSDAQTGARMWRNRSDPIVAIVRRHKNSRLLVLVSRRKNAHRALPCDPPVVVIMSPRNPHVVLCYHIML